MSNWRPVDVRLWNDRKFLACSDGARLLWLFLLTCPSLPVPGVVIGGDAALAEMLGWIPEQLRERFAELSRSGLQVRREGRIVWLPNALKYQSPKNPNMVKGWAKKWDDVPEGPLKDELWEVLRIACKSWSVLFAKLFAKQFGACSDVSSPPCSGMDSAHEHKHDHEHKNEHERVPQDPPSIPDRSQNSFDREAASRRAIGGLAEATWKRLNELRLKHAERLKLAEVMPLPPVSPANEPRGFRELRQRIREEGDNARTVCDHVLRVLDQQSLEEGNIEWLDEKTFLEAPWNTSRSKAIKPKRRGPEPIPTISLTGERAGPEDFERARRALAGELS